MRHGLVSLVVVLFLAIPAGSLASVQHPLDSLVWDEYWTLLEVLQEAGHLEGAAFPLVQLVEPPKDQVWNWKPSDEVPRQARALLRKDGDGYSATVDLTSGKVLSFEKLEGVEVNFLGSELGGHSETVKSDKKVQEALARRGYDNLEFVICAGPPPGYYGTPWQKGKRVANYTCSDTRRSRNPWTREIPGVTAVVDLEKSEVIKVVEEEIVEGGPRFAEYDRASLGEPREVPGPIHTTQPLGPGYERDGNVFSWQGWRFHVRADQRVGPIISTVTHGDRPILYQGFLSEMFVPYQDPSFGWYQRNFLDLGEFPGLGGTLKPLVDGDCPGHAEYLNSVVAGGDGRPVDVPGVLCVFEREPGDPAWRHGADGPQSRHKRDLVVRSAAVVGNYDYVFDWTFQQDGSLRVAIGATGIVESKAVSQATADSGERVADVGVGGGVGEPAPRATADAASGEAADAYGHFVDRHIVAVNHDHYFSYRLDLDVDGTDNNFRIDRLVPKELPRDHPRRSLWVVEGEVAENENDAMLDMNMKKPALWRVTSRSRRNHVGYPTSYQLKPGRNAATLLAPDDYPRQRAGFIDHHLWVTPYAPDELYAAGEHPTLSEPGMGLPEWTESNRELDGDVVLWHTVGMHHFVRAEDWPVMPVMWHSFELRPFDFFDHNPAMDLP